MWGWNFKPLGPHCDRSKNKLCIIGFGGISLPKKAQLETREMQCTGVQHVIISYRQHLTCEHKPVINLTSQL